jgi:predicted HicB family RNase H-like nuclease
MKTKLNDGRKQLTLRIPVEVHRALKIRAAEEGKSVVVITEGLIRQYLTKGETRGNRP